MSHNPEKVAQPREAALRLWAQNPLLCNEDIAAQVGVSVRTVQRYKTMPEFVEKLLILSRRDLHSALPAIYHVAVTNALQGDYRFVKIILDHIEKLEELNRDVKAEHHYLIAWRQ